MSRLGQSISHIKINVNEHPIDAVTIDGKEMSAFQESGKLVTSINSSSDDQHYPSAKCLYDIVGDLNQQLDPAPVYSKNYLTFDIVEGGTLIWKIDQYNGRETVPQKTIQYRVNGGTWNTITSSTTGASFNVNTGDKVELKGQNEVYNATSGYGGDQGNTFRGTAYFNISGNIMSMVGGDNFENLTTLTSDYTFAFLFGNSKVIDASKLVLPATTLTKYCYSSLFEWCYYLTEPPVLPATIMADYCYNCMFWSCTSLTKAPVLPATSLAYYCYRRMFANSALSKAPNLPATTMASYCYSGMFENSKIINPPALPATSLAQGCYNQMFLRCINLTSSPELPATTMADYCYGWMFQSCTNLTRISRISAITLATGCCSNMFYGCTNLTSAIVPNTLTLENNCYNNMFYGCTSLTSMPELPATTLANYCYSGMFQNCTSLKMVSYLPATIMQSGCYSYMFQNCTSLTESPELPATTLANDCYQNMFYGCTNLTSAPVLPATTLVSSCYNGMFRNCSKLNYIECYATNPNKNYSSYWVYGVAQQGTFVGDENVTWHQDENSIPKNWNTNVTLMDYPESNGTLGMYVDDFLYIDDNIENVIENPIQNNIECYVYMGEIGYDGEELYVWESTDTQRHNKVYALTETNNYQTLNSLSLDYDLDNITTYPIYAYLNSDNSQYSDGEKNNILSVGYTTGLKMWVDDFLEDWIWEDAGFESIDEYFDWYLTHLRDAGGNCYYYLEPFEYDGDTCYLWYSYSSKTYIITNTNNANTLTGYSIENDYSNVDTHPIVAFLTQDLSEYNGREGQNYCIIKVESNNPELMIYADNFIHMEDCTFEEYIDDPESYGGNYYEYCEPFEYDGDTYYIWRDMLYETDNVMFLLTDTIDYQTLQSYSLENSMSNLFTHPIVAFIDYDLQESYEGSERKDNIVKVFEL